MSLNIKDILQTPPVRDCINHICDNIFAPKIILFAFILATISLFLSVIWHEYGHIKAIKKSLKRNNLQEKYKITANLKIYPKNILAAGGTVCKHTETDLHYIDYLNLNEKYNDLYQIYIKGIKNQNKYIYFMAVVPVLLTFCFGYDFVTSLPYTIWYIFLLRFHSSLTYRVPSLFYKYYRKRNNIEKQPEYQLDYIDILSGSIGLYVYSEETDTAYCSKLSLQNSRIHNHSIYGLVLQNVNATVVNCEISNCASYCVYLAGGKHDFVHNTIASYYGYPYTNLNIHQNIIADDVAAVYINNLSKNTAKTISSFTNCIITGGRKQSLMVATPLPEYYEGRFDGNYLRSDSLNEAFAANNVYALESDSCVFKNIYYLYKKYHYYDFHLDSVSPARGIGDSIAALSYPMDREGVQRKTKPDAGCYEFSL